ncbi:MAG: O-methyltransferase [Neisseriaceae bacterium]|nr:O-methyltransferase [Neisseriaceae bacterium]MBP6863429.1 O-methyltransferase [Neisseriaceae bacterium]
MRESLRQLLAELAAFGQKNDGGTSERCLKMFNITPEMGAFLALLVQANKAKRILEIGTSNGYSTLWLADAAQSGEGQVTTIERSDYKAKMAAANFKASGLGNIQLIAGEASAFLTAADQAPFDFIFLDARRDHYVEWWPDLKRLLKPQGLLVVDNALSHEPEVRPLAELINADRSFLTSLVPVGKGALLAVKGLGREATT